MDLQPYVETVVQALIGLLVAFLLGATALLKGKVDVWLRARTNDSQRAILQNLASEGMALAESTFFGKGSNKLTSAIGYVRKRLDDVGITMSEIEIHAAIEKAVLDYNAKVKSNG